MGNPLHFPANPSDRDLAGLYRLQVRDLEDFALFLASPEGRILTWNRGVEKTFGYTEGEWLGQDVSMIFSEEDRKAGIPEAEMRTAAEQGRCVDVRWHMAKGEKRVYMTGILKGLRDDADNLIGYSKVFLDDTARKKLDDALTQSNLDLEQFAFVASHDLQEPLRTISLAAGLLKREHGEALSEEADQLLGGVLDAAKRMGRLITDLLAYSRLAHEESRATSVHLDDDLETALTLLQTSIEQSDAIVTHGPLPNVEADRNQMVRVFQNLIGNAVKFRKPDVPPRIHVSAEQVDNEWLIRVKDNGIGFSPENAGPIFAPFKRLNSKEEYPGSGIGLAACKRIVERYGGRIGAESNGEAGATFWFTIPVGEPDPGRFETEDSPSDQVPERA